MKIINKVVGGAAQESDEEVVLEWKLELRNGQPTLLVSKDNGWQVVLNVKPPVGSTKLMINRCLVYGMEGVFKLHNGHVATATEVG